MASTASGNRRACTMASTAGNKRARIEPSIADYKELDLLKEENEFFYVIFDIATPRPHFIIVAKNTDTEQDFGEMHNTQPDQTKKLIEAVRSMMSISKIPSCTLSLHRGGSWYDTKCGRFHAHICVDVGLYWTFFQRNKDVTIRSSLWKKLKNNVDTYHTKVFGYEQHQVKEYFGKEKAGIQKLIEKKTNESLSPQSQMGDQLQMDVPLTDGIRKVLHLSAPKIGFFGKRGTNPEILLPAIDKFAQDLGLTDLKNKGDDKGCHVCLYMYLEEVACTVPTKDWNFDGEIGEDEEVLGYIVTSGPRFYQLCPEEHRQKWVPAFEKSNFACLT